MGVISDTAAEESTLYIHCGEGFFKGLVRLHLEQNDGKYTENKKKIEHFFGNTPSVERTSLAL